MANVSCADERLGVFVRDVGCARVIYNNLHIQIFILLLDEQVARWETVVQEGPCTSNLAGGWFDG